MHWKMHRGKRTIEYNKAYPGPIYKVSRATTARRIWKAYLRHIVMLAIPRQLSCLRMKMVLD